MIIIYLFFGRWLDYFFVMSWNYADNVMTVKIDFQWMPMPYGSIIPQALTVDHFIKKLVLDINSIPTPARAIRLVSQHRTLQRNR